MIADRIQSFCIIGVGAHARNKIIPALLANNQLVVGLVSTQSPSLLPSSPVFTTIDSALEALPKHTVFIVSTPPSLHFHQVRLLVMAGRNVIVEKPAFISGSDSLEIAAICKANGTFVVEGFMHRHTELYKRFLAYWFFHRHQIQTMDAIFCIPDFPANTFRQNRAIESSCLYDMGCYALSLLTDLMLPLTNLRIVHVSQLHNVFEKISIFGEIDGIVISIQIGSSFAYQNTIELRTRDGTTAQFSPFFYGRPGERLITLSTLGSLKRESMVENNAYESMFLVPRSQWLLDQVARSANMTVVATCLENLGKDLLLLSQSEL